MNHKVVIVKNTGQELQKALDDGWGILHVAASTSGNIVYVLRK